VKKIHLEIDTIGSSRTQTNSYTLILSEKNGNRILPIIIGAFETQAIVVALENIHATRPLTHDLFVNFINNFDLKLEEVIINNYQNEIFYAELYFKKGTETIVIDSRPSDAIALAVRLNTPIFIYEEILDKAIEDMISPFKSSRLDIEEENEPDTTSSNQNISSDSSSERHTAPMDEPEMNLKNKTLDELQKMLDEVIEREDYTTAILIRDEINNRK